MNDSKQPNIFRSRDRSSNFSNAVVVMVEREAKLVTTKRLLFSFAWTLDIFGLFPFQICSLANSG
jgi:hypothetical protein